MKLDDSLEKQVRGCLLSDIRSLQVFRLPPRTHTGWLGYPLLMTVVAGIELLGTLGCDEEHGLEAFEAKLVTQSRHHCKAIARADPVVTPTVSCAQNATIVSSPSITSALVLSTRGYGASW